MRRRRDVRRGLRWRQPKRPMPAHTEPDAHGTASRRGWRRAPIGRVGHRADGIDDSVLRPGCQSWKRSSSARAWSQRPHAQDGTWRSCDTVVRMRITIAVRRDRRKAAHAPEHLGVDEWVLGEAAVEPRTLGGCQVSTSDSRIAPGLSTSSRSRLTGTARSRGAPSSS